MHKVTSILTDGKIDETRLLQVNRMAITVFEPDLVHQALEGLEDLEGRIGSLDQNLLISVWKEKLSKPHANLLYIADSSGLTAQANGNAHNGGLSHTSESTQQILGMLLNFPRNQDGLESYHVWMAAVHPAARGLGLFSRLIDAAKEDARAAGYKTLTIATYPDRFKTMYALLSREGSGWQVVKWEGATETGNRKVVMKMELD